MAPKLEFGFAEIRMTRSQVFQISREYANGREEVRFTNLFMKICRWFHGFKTV